MEHKNATSLTPKARKLPNYGNIFNVGNQYGNKYGNHVKPGHSAFMVAGCRITPDFLVKESKEYIEVEGKDRKFTATATLVFAVILSVFACLIVTGCATAQATFADEPREQVEFHYVCDWGKTEPPVGLTKVLQEQKEREEAQAAQEQSEAYYEPAYVDYGYDESLNNNPAYLNYGSDYGNPFQSQGVAFIGDTEFNWYSQKVMPGGGLDELNSNGRHVDESSGFVMDGDGYIAVASPYGKDEVGTVVETPYGPGKVYDENDGDAYDLYTDF